VVLPLQLQAQKTFHLACDKRDTLQFVAVLHRNLHEVTQLCTVRPRIKAVVFDNCLRVPFNFTHGVKLSEHDPYILQSHEAQLHADCG
jgi:hypothetical protein